MDSESLSGQTIGPYTILEQIGRGGMTVVYRAQDLAHDRSVALKVLSPYIAHEASFQARFRREIQVLQALRHPNVVPILDFGEARGTLFIVMPYLPSGTLQDRIRRRPLTPREAMRVVDQVSSALQRAHEAGVVHRDIKPSNILLDEKGNALLSDFGFALVPDSSMSLTGSMLIGTPAFMSPELCQGAEVTPRSDQYSLGIVLYQLATGRLPFDADTPMGIVIQHINQPLPRPRYFSPNLPDAVEATLVKALAKDPAHRFSSVAAFNEAFQQAMRAALTASGKLKMRSGVMKRPGQYFPDEVPTPTLRFPSRFWTGRRVAAAALLLLVLCPATAWAIGELLPRSAGAVAVLITPAGWESTEAAIRTAIAGSGQVDAQTMGTYVAQTLVAFGASPAGSATATPNASASPGSTASNTSPAGTPTRTATPTSRPAATNTPPPPTIDPADCTKPTQNPHYQYCTPTP